MPSIRSAGIRRPIRFKSGSIERVAVIGHVRNLGDGDDDKDEDVPAMATTRSAIPKDKVKRRKLFVIMVFVAVEL